MPKITCDCPGFTDCSPQMVYNVVYNFRIIVVCFCFGLCFYVISKPLLLLSVKRTKTLKSMSQPTDQPTERMNERMIFRRSCCCCRRRHHHHLRCCCSCHCCCLWVVFVCTLTCIYIYKTSAVSCCCCFFAIVVKWKRKKSVGMKRGKIIVLR